MFFFVLFVGLVFSVAAFVLRNAEPRIVRVFWWLVALLAVGIAILVVALIRDQSLYRAFFSTSLF